jgi:hypothetical protein
VAIVKLDGPCPVGSFLIRQSDAAPFEVRAVESHLHGEPREGETVGLLLRGPEGATPVAEGDEFARSEA